MVIYATLRNFIGSTFHFAGNSKQGFREALLRACATVVPCKARFLSTLMGSYATLRNFIGSTFHFAGNSW
jgi:hypothetical protein